LSVIGGVLTESIGWPVTLLKADNETYIAGYASVDIVDKQGDRIPTYALRDAFGRFMKSGYRNVQVAHSNITVGEVVPTHNDSKGRTWKSEVDETGLFVVVKLRNDIEKAKEVQNAITKGQMRSFSIGGQALKRVERWDEENGNHREIQKLDLHEITICEKGVNQESKFDILKQMKGETMVEAENRDAALSELQGVLGKIASYMDETTEKAEESTNETVEKEDDEFFITPEYLEFLEEVAKDAGHDNVVEKRGMPEGLKDYMKGKGDKGKGKDKKDESKDESKDDDKTEKGYRPEDNTPHDGEPAGHEITGGKPEGPWKRALTGLQGGKGNQNVIKADGLDPALLEQAYQHYKSRMDEHGIKETLRKQFGDRYEHEVAVELSDIEKGEYDARTDIGTLASTIQALESKIDAISIPGGSAVFAKSQTGPTVDIPDNETLYKMSWDEVHSLAENAISGVIVSEGGVD